MFDTGVVAAAAQWHDSAVGIAKEFRTEQPGADAVEVLADMLAASRQGDLAICLAIERADRSGEFAANGSVSTTAFVRTAANETAPWASKRIQIGRALVDRLPKTWQAWERGDLGLEHAWEIVKATKDIDDPALAGRVEAALAGATPALSPEVLRQLGERIRSQTAPDQTDKKYTNQHAQQKLSISQTLDGRWDLSGRLDPEFGAVIKT